MLMPMLCTPVPLFFPLLVICESPAIALR